MEKELTVKNGGKRPLNCQMWPVADKREAFNCKLTKKHPDECDCDLHKMMRNEVSVDDVDVEAIFREWGHKTTKGCQVTQPRAAVVDAIQNSLAVCL